jgi:hypothetical protein
MDAGKALGDHSLHAEIERDEGCMLAGRALAIVRAADDHSLALRLAALGEIRVDLPKAEFGKIGDVGAVGENLCASGHDVIGGDVVADLKHCLRFNGIRQSLRHREFLDVRPAQNFDRLRLLRRGRQLDHIVVDEEFRRKRHLRRVAQRARVGQHTCQRTCGGNLRADEIDARVRRAGTALKVAVEGAQGNAFGIGGLPHPDAGAAGRFENAGARGDHISQRAVLREHIEHLLGAGRDGKAHIWVHGFALEDRGHFEHIEQGGIRTGADADLVNLDRANLRYTLDIIRAVRHGRHRRKGGEVNFNHLVILRVCIGQQLDPILLAALRF